MTIFILMNRNNFLVRTPVNVGEDELGVSFSFSFTKPLKILALDLVSLIAGFQCHAIQNRSKSKSKPFNR